MLKEQSNVAVMIFFHSPKFNPIEVTDFLSINKLQE